MTRATAAVLALACLSAQAAPAVYTLDPEHTFVHFEVLHFGTSTLRGRFGPVSGEITFDPDARRGETGLRIATAGVNTGFAPLDKRLCAPDLLDCAGAPEAYFVASNFRFDGDRLAEVRGEFTLRGASRPLALRAVQFRCGPHPELQREFCGGDFEAELKRSDFGASYGLPLVADTVRLRIQVEAVKR